MYKNGIWSKGRSRSINEKCYVCGFDRYCEAAHIVPKRLGGGYSSLNIIILCPNHHKLFDYGLLSVNEVAMIEKYLLVAIENNSGNMAALEYLYFQLGLRQSVPKWMQATRWILINKTRNRYM